MSEYKINTLLDIMALDDDQIDRLCSELPSSIKYAKSFVDLLQAASGKDAAEALAAQIISPLTWFDDGRADITITVKTLDDEELVMKVEREAAK